MRLLYHDISMARRMRFARGTLLALVIAIPLALAVSDQPCLGEEPLGGTEGGETLTQIASLRNVAIELARQNRYSEAREKIDAAQALATKSLGGSIKERSLHATLYRVSGDLWKLEGRMGDATREYRRAVSILSKIESNREVGALLFSVAKRLDELDRRAAELAFRAVARQFGSAAGDARNAAVALTHAAQSCWRDGRPSDALETIAEVERVIASILTEKEREWMTAEIEKLAAGIARDSGDTKRAIDHIRSAEEHYRRAEDEESAINMIQVRVKILQRAGLNEDAVEVLEELVRLRERAGAPEETANARLDLVKGYHEAGRVQEAITVSERIISFLREQGRIEQLTDFLLWRAQTLIQLGMLDEAEAPLIEGLSIWKKDTGVRAAILRKLLAALRREQSRDDEAVELYEAFLGIVAQSRNPDDPSMAVAGLGDVTEALEALHAIHHKAERFKAATGCLTRMSWVLLKNADLEEATSSVERCVRYASDTGTVREEHALLLRRCGNLHCEADQPARALTHLENALALMREVKHDPMQRYEVLRILSYALFSLERYDEAISRIDEALEYLSNAKYDSIRAMMLRKRAGALHRSGRSEQALLDLDEAIRLFGDDPKWVADLADAAFIQMTIANSLGRNDETRVAADTVLRLYRRHGDAIDLGRDFLMVSMLLSAPRGSSDAEVRLFNARMREAYEYASSVDHEAWKSWLLQRVVQCMVVNERSESDLLCMVTAQSLRARRALTTLRLRGVPSAQRDRFLAEEMRTGFLAPETRLLLRRAFAGDPTYTEAARDAADFDATFLFNVARQQRMRLLDESSPEVRADWHDLESLRRELATLSLQSEASLSRMTVEQRHRRTQRLLDLSTRIGEAEDRLRKHIGDGNVAAQEISTDMIRSAIGDGVFVQFVRYVAEEPEDSNPFTWDAKKAESETTQMVLRSRGGGFSGDMHRFELGPDGMTMDTSNTTFDLTNVLFDYETDRLVPDRLGVFVVRSGTDDVVAIDLGPLELINGAISAFRTRMQRQVDLNDFNETQLGHLSAKVRKLIFDPIRRHLGAAKSLFVIPDGSVAICPFEALAASSDGKSWTYLAEELKFTYLSSGRDLLGEDAPSVRARDAAVIIGAADFDADSEEIGRGIAWGHRPATVSASISTTTTLVREVEKGAERGSLRSLAAGGGEDGPRWDELADLDRFVRTQQVRLARAVEEVTVFSGPRASEENALRVRSPKILMFATHGHFQAVDPGHWITTRVAQFRIAEDGVNDEFSELVGRLVMSSQSWGSPLMRSSLVLAGANRRGESRLLCLTDGGVLSLESAATRGMTTDEITERMVELGDGWLTAYEITGMDLRGTELVALVACETGLGKPDTADGLTGLTRALRLAGANSVIASLWVVPVDETLSQFDRFFRAWLDEGVPVREAFHRSQREALASARRERNSGHPIWWAGFVLVGGL